jgi:YD repeat-containing protein
MLPRPTAPPKIVVPKERPHSVEARRPSGGTPLSGPPLAAPMPRIFDRHVAANSRAAVEAFLGRHPLPPASASSRPQRSGRPGPGARRTSSVDVNQVSTTGLNPWWSYEEGGVPGVGVYLLNLAYANLVLQPNYDMDVKYRGLAFAFQRTYNSASGHDYVSSDGSTEIGQYGNGWTNTFDVHMSTNNCPNGGYSRNGFNGFSIYDEDGARYDYCYNAAGTLIPPPGMEGTTLVTYDGGSFYWTRKDGRLYTFYAPYYSGTMAAYSGRLGAIYGRNQNNHIELIYSWAPDASSSANLTSISAATDGGLTATLSFADFNGRRLLSQIARPDGLTVTYGYDSAGNLVSVTKPGNNSSSSLTEAYGGYGTALWAAGPRWEASGGTDGGYVSFSYVNGSTTKIGGIQRSGVMNFQPSDGTSSLLQPSAATGSVMYSVISVDSSSPEYTTVTDTDGRQEYHYMGGFGNQTGSQVYTGSQWLGTDTGWDTHNNRISQLDVRGNEMDLAYDANDNVIAVAAPQVTTSQGTFRPTKLFDYDAYNNLVAYCDESETHQAGADWAARPAASDSLCSSHAGGTVAYTSLSYTYPSYEPAGELTQIKAPSGYTRRIAYSPAQQNNVDYGLPTSVTGDQITQGDGSQITPTETMWWDAAGRLRCQSSGQGTSVYTTDTNGQNLSSADADDSSANASSLCHKTTGQPGWNTQTTFTYFADGHVQSSQTPAERSAGVSTTFAYDQDGNTVAQINHHGCVPNQCSAGTEQSWFDGDDRLVETKRPLDANSPSDFPWINRYLYDLSQGAGSTTLSGTRVVAHGNMFEIEKRTPTSWTDVAFASFDALNRLATLYRFAPCPAGSTSGPVYCSNAPYATSNAWDAGPQTLGLLASISDALGETKTYSYDATGQLTSVQYTGDGGATPALQYAYDASGRVTTANAAGVGTQTYTYAADGTVRTVQEPALIGSGTRTYTYNGDDSLAQVDVADPLLTQTQLYRYAYRNDGLLANERFGVGGGTMTYGYTDAGRLTSVSDPGRSPARTQSYLTNGLVGSYSIPAGTYGNLSYDAEANLTGYTGYGGESVANTYNDRGELIGESFTPNPVANGFSAWPSFSYQSVQGVLIQSPGQQWDGRTGALLAMNVMSYDAVGRLSQYSNKPFTYDAENRLTLGSTDQIRATGNCGNGRTIQGMRAGGNGGYTYGPDGNIVRSVDVAVDLSRTTNNWHWSGNTLIYRDANNAPGLVNADNAGAIPPGGGTPGLTVYDRELNGLITSRHNTTGYASWTAPNPFMQKCVEQNPPPASPGYTDPSPDAVPVGHGLIDDGNTTIDPSGTAPFAAAMAETVTPSSSASSPATVYDLYGPNNNCDSGWYDYTTHECTKYPLIGGTRKRYPECPGCTNGPVMPVIPFHRIGCLPSHFATISFTSARLFRVGRLPLPLVGGSQIEITRTGNVYGGFHFGVGFGGGVAATLGWARPASKLDGIVNGFSWILSTSTSNGPRIGSTPLRLNQATITSNSSGKAGSVGVSIGDSFEAGFQLNGIIFNHPVVAGLFCPEPPTSP